VSWEFPANFHLAAAPTADCRFEPRRYAAEGSAAGGGQRVGCGTIFCSKILGRKPFRGAYRLASFGVEIAERAFRVGGIEFRLALDLPAKNGLDGAIHSVASELGWISLALCSLPGCCAPCCWRLRALVCGCRGYTDSIGWIRYILDQRRRSLYVCSDEDIRAGKLREKIDVLLYGMSISNSRSRFEGLPKRWGPMAQENARRLEFRYACGVCRYILEGLDTRDWRSAAVCG